MTIPTESRRYADAGYQLSGVRHALGSAKASKHVGQQGKSTLAGPPGHQAGRPLCGGKSLGLEPDTGV